MIFFKLLPSKQAPHSNSNIQDVYVETTDYTKKSNEVWT